MCMYRLQHQCLVVLMCVREHLPVMLQPLSPGMVDEIAKARDRMDETLESEVEKTFADFQTETFDECKALAKHTQEAVQKSVSGPDELLGTSRDVTATYVTLVESARGALATIESAEVCV